MGLLCEVIGEYFPVFSRVSGNFLRGFFLVWRRERSDENPTVRQNAPAFWTAEGAFRLYGSPEGGKTRDAAENCSCIFAIAHIPVRNRVLNLRGPVYPSQPPQSLSKPAGFLGLADRAKRSFVV